MIGARPTPSRYEYGQLATGRPFAARVVEKLIDQCSSRPQNRFDPRARFLVTGD